MSHRKLLPLVLALASCNHDAVPGGGQDLSGTVADMATAAGADLSSSGADFAGTVVDFSTVPALDLSGFCGDPNSPRIQLNNMLANSPVVIAAALALNCCDAASLEWESMQIATPITLTWRHQVGQGPNPPLTIDLANIPMGWSVSVVSGCNPFTDVNCMPSDRYDNGLQGTLTIAGNFGNYTMTACVTAAEGGMPHPVMHLVELWTPPIVAH